MLGEDVLEALMAGKGWLAMARQLLGRQQAGVDLSALLPQLGRMTASVQQAVAANIAGT